MGVSGGKPLHPLTTELSVVSQWKHLPVGSEVSWTRASPRIPPFMHGKTRRPSLHTSHPALRSATSPGALLPLSSTIWRPDKLLSREKFFKIWYQFGKSYVLSNSTVSTRVPTASAPSDAHGPLNTGLGPATLEHGTCVCRGDCMSIKSARLRISACQSMLSILISSDE